MMSKIVILCPKSCCAEKNRPGSARVLVYERKNLGCNAINLASMRKVSLFLLTALLSITVSASVFSPYTVDFNTAVDVSATDFRAALGWGHLVNVGAYPAQKVTYTYVADGGVGGSGCIQAGNQYYQDWWTGDGTEVELNDLLVTPAVSGTATLQVKLANTSGNIRFYVVTKEGNTYVRGALIPFEDPGLVSFDYTEVELTGFEDGTMIGIRAENVLIDDFSATSADVIPVKGLTVTSVTPAVNDLFIDCDENNQFTISATVKVKNTGEVTLSSGDEGYNVNIALMKPGEGMDYVVDRLLSTQPIEADLAPGEESEEFTVTAVVDEASIEALEGNDTKARRYDVQEGITMTTKAIHNYTPIPYQPIPYIYDHDSKALDNGGTQQFGLVTSSVTRTITISNDGAAPLNVTEITVEGEGFTTTATAPVTIAKHESLDIDVTLASEVVGAKTGKLTVKGEGIEDQVVNLVGEVLDPSKWYVDFEDGQIPANMVNMGGWAAKNNLVTGDNKYYAESTENGKLISPRLKVEEGETLSFDAARNYTTPCTVEVYYSTDRSEWTLLRTLSNDAQDEADQLTSEYTGSAWGTNTKYNFTRFTVDNVPVGEGYIAFATTNARIDNILGFSVVDVEHDVFITAMNIPAVGTANNAMQATATLKNLTANAEAEGVYTARLYFDDELMAEAEAVELAANGENTYTFDLMPIEVGTFQARVEFVGENFSAVSDNVQVTITEELASRDVVVGTSNDSENRNAAPLNLYYGKSESETVYTAGLLGIAAGTKITRIAFKGHGSSAKTISGNLKVWLENTDDATPQNVLLDADKTAAMTSVYDGSYTYNVTKTDDEIVVVELATPFEYTGKNLRVCLHSESSSWATVYFQHDKTVTGQSVYRASDSSLPGSFTASSLPVMYLTVSTEALTYSGHVYDQDGNAIEGAVVTVTAADEQQPEQPAGMRGALGAKVTYTGTTDADGKYEISVIQSERNYDVTVAATGYKTATGTLTFVDGEPQTADYTLEPDTHTGVADVKSFTIDENAPIYDVMGRQVKDATIPGIYIQNGHKFIVK